jgi:hypothetical protein
LLILIEGFKLIQSKGSADRRFCLSQTKCYGIKTGRGNRSRQNLTCEGQVEAIELLVRLGADKDATNPPSGEGQVEAIELLVRLGADKDATNPPSGEAQVRFCRDRFPCRV